MKIKYMLYSKGQGNKQMSKRIYLAILILEIVITAVGVTVSFILNKHEPIFAYKSNLSAYVAIILAFLAVINILCQNIRFNYSHFLHIALFFALLFNYKGYSRSFRIKL